MTSPAETDDGVIRRGADETFRRSAAAACLASCRAEDFDGHTVFATLSAEQRLDWADRAARLTIEMRGRARSNVPSRDNATE